MTVPIVLDRTPQVICQCVPPCHMPVVEARAEDGTMPGCRLPQGHPPPCSAEGPDALTYRDPPARLGPMLKMTLGESDIWHATCHRCGRSYALGMVTLSAEATEAAHAVEDAMDEALPGLTEAAATATSDGPLDFFDSTYRSAARPHGVCLRCGRINQPLSSSGICGTCGDDLREEAKADAADGGVA